MTAAPFNRVAIIGVGLIGGSFALALKRAGLAGRVIGVGRGRANLERALELGVIDEIADARSACTQADLVFLATPVGQMAAVMAAIAPVLAPSVIITDGGSTKQDVVALARRHLGAHLARFVPAHPIAGGEKTGAEAAHADLFDARKVIVTPLAETAPDASAAVAAAWRACGAQVFELSPELHDRIYAAVSHLPHLLAFALIDGFAAKPYADVLFEYAGRGLADTLRLAGGSAEMWRDIVLANRDALLAELDDHVARLAGARAMLAANDGAALEAMFANARQTSSLRRGPGSSALAQTSPD